MAAKKRRSKPRRLLYFGVVFLTVAAWGWIGWRVWLWQEQQEVQRWVESHGGTTMWGDLSHGLPSVSRTPKWLVEWLDRPVFDDLIIMDIHSHISPIRPEEFRCLEKLPGPFMLNLGGSAFGDTHLEAVAGLKRLHYLELNQTGISGPGYRMLGDMTPLMGLHVTGKDLDGKWLTRVGRLENLELLTLDGWLIEDGEFDPLSNLSNLKDLHMRFCEIRGTALAGLNGLNELKLLDLTHTRVDIEAFLNLPTLPRLELLRLPGGIDVNGIPAIVRQRSLRSLAFYETEFSESSLDRIIERLPNLNWVQAKGADLSAEWIESRMKQGVQVER